MIILTKTEVTYFENLDACTKYLDGLVSSGNLGKSEAMSIKTGGTSTKQVSRAAMPAVDTYTMNDVPRVCMKEV